VVVVPLEGTGSCELKRHSRAPCSPVGLSPAYSGSQLNHGPKWFPPRQERGGHEKLTWQISSERKLVLVTICAKRRFVGRLSENAKNVTEFLAKGETKAR